MAKKIAEFSKSRSQTVRVTIDKFRGEAMIDCRVWFLDERIGKPVRSRHGLTLSLRHLPNLLEAMEKALAKARRARLL